jgi:thiamine-monophosphate kinase
MVEVGNQFGVAIVGGNISSASKVMITITVLGALKGKGALTRSAAKAGEQIAVTGYTGLSAAGLRMLKQNLNFDSETNKLFREAHLKPVPRVEEGQILLRHKVCAAIDISDGLIADLSHICEASQVSARVKQELVSIHPSLRTYFGDDCEQLALNGGEDYELLFTATSHVVDKVSRVLSCPVTVIGEITAGIPGQVMLVDVAGKSVPLQQAGWEHFKSCV